jgi:hypothetical protein
LVSATWRAPSACPNSLVYWTARVWETPDGAFRAEEAPLSILRRNE